VFSVRSSGNQKVRRSEGEKIRRSEIRKEKRGKRKRPSAVGGPGTSFPPGWRQESIMIAEGSKLKVNPMLYALCPMPKPYIINP
jgi:hypothetical protein